MTGRQVGADHVTECWVHFSRQPFLPPCLPERSRGGFGGEVVFRPELAVEATVRQPGALHDVRDSDPFKATLTEERARHVENLFAIRRRLLARHPHDLTPFLVPLDTIHDVRHIYS